MPALKDPNTEIRVIPLPTDSPTKWLNIASNLLSTSECADLIDQHSPYLEPQAVSFTSRSRYIFQDESLASTIWTRLHPFYNTLSFADGDGYEWTPSHVNDHFRFCKYVAGDGFTPHVDGEKLLAPDTQTMVTLNIYLNTTPIEAGGATRILVPTDLDGKTPSEDLVEFRDRCYKILHSTYPVAGSAAIFPSGGPLHDGAVLLAGEKYLLRTDIVFQRSPAFRLEMERLNGLTGAERDVVAEELGRKALDLAIRLEDGGYAGAWEWYKRAFRLCPKLERER